jgi:putative glutamine amidotransferase
MGLYDRIRNFLFGPPPEQPVELPQVPYAQPQDMAAGVPKEKQERKPIVGISGAGDTKSVTAMVAQIRAAGGEPLFLGGHAKRIAQGGNVNQAVANDLRNLDALVIMGNDGDIDPAKYGQARQSATKVETDTARAAYEECAIGQALDSGIPLLGICGGMQRINVLGGGTLHQHVPDLVGDNHHMQSDAPFVPVQLVSIAGDTKLGEIAGATKRIYTPTHQELPPGTVMENSFHHQAVAQVRSDFRVSGVSDDGIIQAIEPAADSRYGDQYVVGVQWHPEFGASDLGPKIANSITSAAKAYAVEHGHEAEIQQLYYPLPGGVVERIMGQRQQAAAQAAGNYIT